MRVLSALLLAAVALCTVAVAEGHALGRLRAAGQLQAAVEAEAEAAGPAQPGKKDNGHMYPLSVTKAQPEQGPGVFLANTPGGFYMGRVMPGETFFAAYEYTSTTKSQYYWGHSRSACFWLGPPQQVKGMTGYTTVKHTEKVRTSSTCKASLAKLRNDATFAKDLNCPIHKGTFGARTTMNKASKLYWNLTWKSDYSGGALRDFAKDLPAGSQVFYRFTTRDGQAAVVQVPGVGWGFVPASDVIKVIGKFGYGDEKCHGK